jgi:hypothetical protein
MGGIPALIFRIIGLPGVVALGMLVFYEGLPLGPIRDIPFVGPALAGLVDGRVDRERQLARDVIQAEARAAAMAAIQERSKDNAEISRFDQAQLCAELGGRWIDIEARCD